MLKTRIKDQLRRFGWDIISYNPKFNKEARKIHLINTFGIDYILDVGANAGQFGKYIRKMGYGKNIVSFEPINEAYHRLLHNISSDKFWEAKNYGLGAEVGKKVINISKNSFSSSIKETLPLHLNVHPNSSSISKQDIDIYTIDKFIEENIDIDKHNLMLKIDTQGFEEEVLNGAHKSLEKMKIVVLEMSVEPLYSEQKLIAYFLEKMTNLGFKLSIIEPCDEDYSSLSILQLDGWFINNNSENYHDT